MEEIRGVKTDKALQTLVSHLLIKEMEEQKDQGVLFYTEQQKEFLDTFGLKTLDDLPLLSEENEQMNEADLFFGSLQEISK